MAFGQRVFFRVLSAASGTICKLQLLFDDVPQLLTIVAKDGVVLDTTFESTLDLPPASRVEFVAQMPVAGIRSVQLVLCFHPVLGATSSTHISIRSCVCSYDLSNPKLNRRP